MVGEYFRVGQGSAQGKKGKWAKIGGRGTARKMHVKKYLPSKLQDLGGSRRARDE